MNFLNKKWKTTLLTICFTVLTVLLLKYPQESLTLSAAGLTLWFHRMIPTLLPFMILTGVMIRLDLAKKFARFFSPVMSPLFRVSANGIYVIVTGFLCGFPMGAKVISDLYEAGKLDREEAAYLLSFCNNIGPVYFISFVLPTLGLTPTFGLLFGMYGIPLCYGILLRRLKAFSPGWQSKGRKKSYQPPSPAGLIAAEQPKKMTMLNALDESVTSGMISIARLGGYMVLFNLLNLPAAILAACFPADLIASCVNGISCLLEITGGIHQIGMQNPLFVLIILPFGGFSCLAQTYSMIKNTDLSLTNYFFHKMIQTGITAVYYILLF